MADNPLPTNEETRQRILNNLFGSCSDDEEDDQPAPKRRRTFRNLFHLLTETIGLPKSTGGIPPGFTMEDRWNKRDRRDAYLHEVLRVNELTKLICGEMPHKEMKESTRFFLHWLIEEELMKQTNWVINHPDVSKADEANVLEEHNQDVAEAYLKYMARNVPWSEEYANNCIRALAFIRLTGPNNVDRQSKELFILEHKIYAHIVLGNRPQVLDALKRLRVMSSGLERPRNITDLSESEWRSSLNINQQTARHLLTDVAECLWTEKQFMLAHHAFHYADNVNRMEDCVTRLQSAAANSLCSVCMSDTLSLVFRPCNHATTCHTCYKKMKSRGRRVACPICKRTVESATAVNVQGVSQ